MKRKGKIWFFVVAILIFFLAFSTIFGITTQYGDIKTPIVKGVEDIRFGIDIRGGVDASFVPSDGTKATDDQMAAAQAVIEQRLIGLGITDYEIYKDTADSRIILRFPWKVGEEKFDPEAALDELSTAAILTFREGMETDETTGEPTGVTAETVILQGNDVQKATARYVPASTGKAAEYLVELQLSPEAGAKFEEATARISQEENGVISIWMDNEMISAPTVQQTISGTSAVITSPTFTAESAEALANKINAGSLPFALKADSFSTISPTLGGQSLQAMVIAGIVAFVLVCAFMLFLYKLPGFVACLALLGQVAGMLALISGYFAVFNSFTLTLPGIAGIILSIGMGVDANVITNERIKEELRTGKRLDAALKAGFQRGLAPIIDGNVTVIIVAVILMGAFGPTDGPFAILLKPIFFAFGVSTAGSIYSFGYTLLIGVLLNFVFSVFCSRIMLTSLSKFNFLRKPTFYGGLKEGAEAPRVSHLNIVSNWKKFFTLSGVVIAGIILVSVVFGVQMDVQFRGGAIITYSYTGGDIDTGEAKGIADEALGSDVTVQLGESTAGEKTLAVTMPGSETMDSAQLGALSAALDEKYPDSNFEQLTVSNVDAAIGNTFLLKCVVAVVAASLLILVYIAFRFRKIGGWVGGFTAVVALVHDLIFIYGVFVILRIPLNGNFIAAVLTILGYSINDTVVIYDRVRENRGLYGKKMPFSRLVNLSINQSMRRSIYTSVTTMMALGCVCIFAVVYGLEDIFTFAFPLMIGMVSGVYSTVCLAGPLWVLIEDGRKGKKKKPAANGSAKAKQKDEPKTEAKDGTDAAAEKDEDTEKETPAGKKPKPAKA